MAMLNNQMVIYHRHTYPHHFMPFGPGTWYHIPLNIVALRGHQAFGARVADTGLGAHTMNRRELSTSRNINRVSSYQIILHQNPAFLPFIFWVVHGVSPFHQLILVLWGLIVGHVPGESIVPTSPVQGPPSNRWSVEILWPPLPCLEERGCLSRGSSYTQGLLFTCWIWSRYIEYLQFQFKTDFFSMEIVQSQNYICSMMIIYVQLVLQSLEGTNHWIIPQTRLLTSQPLPPTSRHPSAERLWLYQRFPCSSFPLVKPGRFPKAGAQGAQSDLSQWQLCHGSWATGFPVDVRNKTRWYGNRRQLPWQNHKTPMAVSGL